MSRPASHPRRILLVRNDRIGDLVLTLPAIEAVRRSFPAAEVTALVSGQTAELLHGNRGVDRVLVDDSSDSAWKLARRLKSLQFDAVLVFNTTTRNCLAVWLAGIPRRVCWAYKPIGFACGNHRVTVHRSHPPVHESEFTLAFVRRLGAAVELKRLRPQLTVAPDVHARVNEQIHAALGTGGPLFGVHPGNEKSAFNWPLERYVELVRKLSQFGRVMITGSRQEAELLAAIRGRIGRSSHPVAFFHDFTLTELSAAIARQTVLTVSSTGPMHIAGVLDTPVVALFSPHPVHAPEKWAPLGQRQTLFVAPLEAGEDPRVPAGRASEVMSRIDVDTVLHANLEYAAAAAHAHHGEGLSSKPSRRRSTERALQLVSTPHIPRNLP